VAAISKMSTQGEIGRDKGKRKMRRARKGDKRRRLRDANGRLLGFLLVLYNEEVGLYTCQYLRES